MTDPVAGAPAALEESARIQNPAAPAPVALPTESLLATPANETAPTGTAPTAAEPKAPPAEDQAPVSYEPFALPQGVEVDTAALAEAQSLFAEARLSQPQAQKLVDLYAGKLGELVRRQIETQIAAAQDRQKAWVAEVKNDPELGGSRFGAARAAAQTALTRFGTPELRRSLDELGVSNSPQLFRFFVRVGRAISEESWAGSRPDADGLSAAATLYPQQNTNKE